jgi:hypothetical protein
MGSDLFSVGDLHHSDADPDLAFHLDVDLDPAFQLMRILIQLPKMNDFSL